MKSRRGELEPKHRGGCLVFLLLTASPNTWKLGRDKRASPGADVWPSRWELPWGVKGRA